MWSVGRRWVVDRDEMLTSAKAFDPGTFAAPSAQPAWKRGDQARRTTAAMTIPRKHRSSASLGCCPTSQQLKRPRWIAFRALLRARCAYLAPVDTGPASRGKGNPARRRPSEPALSYRSSDRRPEATGRGDSAVGGVPKEERQAPWVSPNRRSALPVSGEELAPACDARQQWDDRV
jgi:hypothetical protein